MKLSYFAFLIVLLSSCNFSNESNNEEKQYEIYGDDIVSLNEYFASKNASKLSRKGVDLGLKKKYDEAEKVFRKALDEEPNNPIILNNIGLTFYNRGIYNEAIKYFTRALKVSDSTSLLAATNLGLTYYEQMDYARALKIMSFTLNQSKNDNTRKLIVRIHRVMVNIELENCNEIEKDRKVIEYLRYNNQLGDFKEKIEQLDIIVKKLCQ